MRKILLAVLILAAFVSLTGCGTGEDEYKTVDVQWPVEDVPAITKAMRVNSITKEEEGYWEIDIDVSEDQYKEWESKLKARSFIKTENGFFSADVSLLFKKNTSYAPGGKYSLIIDLDKRGFSWPGEFSAFPEYRGTGMITLYTIDEYIDVDNNSELILTLGIINEEEDFESYKETLKKSGFQEQSSGEMTKKISGKVYTFYGIIEDDGEIKSEDSVKTVQIQFSIK